MNRILYFIFRHRNQTRNRAVPSRNSKNNLKYRPLPPMPIGGCTKYANSDVMVLAGTVQQEVNDDNHKNPEYRINNPVQYCVNHYSTNMLPRFAEKERVYGGLNWTILINVIPKPFGNGFGKALRDQVVGGIRSLHQSVRLIVCHALGSSNRKGISFCIP